MRIATSALLIAAVVAPLPGTSAQAGPNVALCFAIQNNYNHCIVQQQRGGGWNRGYGGGYGGYGGHGGGYGGGYDGYDDDGGYYRQQRRAARAQQACMPWLIQLQANRCI